MAVPALLYFRLVLEWFCIFITTCIIWIPVTAFLLYLLGILIKHHGRRQLPHLRQTAEGENSVVIGFFHPYCNAGGGGERVLWVAVRALQKKYKHVRCVVYTGDTDATPEEIVQKARQRFNIAIPRTDKNNLEFVYLKRRKLVEASPYPFFTILGQSIGSMVLGVEAMWKFVPDIYIDSMGYAFTLPIFKYLGSCSVGCYVHYPTISTDMLEKVTQRTATYNNASVISRSPLLSSCKLLYYRLFAYVYGMMGKRSDLIMVNSSWTKGHILAIWQAPDKTYVIYPPCDTREFLTLPVDIKSVPKIIISIAQFRPEKDHPLQIKAFSEFLSRRDEPAQKQYRLVLVGSCRNEEDAERVKNLKELARDLKIENSVEFRLNVSFEDLKKSLCEATIGLHTMWNEHFGIGVVEMMAGGTIVLAHNTGGPRMDIVKDFEGGKTGYLASDVTSYADAMQEILRLSEKEMLDIQMNARKSIDRFSDENFESSFLDAMQCLLI